MDYKLLWKLYNTEIKEAEKIDDIFRGNIKKILNNMGEDQKLRHLVIFKSIELLKRETKIDYSKILKTLDLLNVKLLETKIVTYKDCKYSIEPFQQQWYRERIKSLFELKEYKECLGTIEKAQTMIKEYYKFNEMEFTRTKFRILGKQKEHMKEAIKELNILYIRSRKWYILQDITEIYIAYGDNEKAIKTLEKIVIDTKIEAKMKINDFKLLGDLYKDKNKWLSNLFYEAFLAIRKENKWKLNFEILETIKKKEEEIKNFNEIFKDILNNINNNLNYSKGVILKYDEERGFGFIKTEKESYYFHKSGISKHVKLKKGIEVKFIIEESFDKKKNKESKIATKICRT